MEIMSLLIPILGQYLIDLPVFFVWLVGGVLAVQHRRAQRLSVGLFLSALSIAFLLNLILTPLNVLLPQWALQNNGSAAQFAAISFALGLIGRLVAAVYWSLIVAALWVAWRKAEA